MNRSRQLALFGGMILIFSIFLPWATHTSPTLGLNNSINGYSTDGAFGAIFGFIIILIAAMVKGRSEKRYSYIVAFLAIVAFYITFRTITTIGSVIRGSEDVISSVRIGPYLSMLGALLSFIGGVMKVPPPLHDQKTSPPRS